MLGSPVSALNDFLMRKRMHASANAEFYVSLSCSVLESGTVNSAPCVSVSAALDLRQWLGGERLIDKYWHNLAIDGGRTIAKTLNTDEDGQFITHMVNVVMPLSGDFKPTLQLDLMFKNEPLVKHNLYDAVIIIMGCGG